MSWDSDTQAGPTPKKPSKALAAHHSALDPWRSIEVLQERTVAGKNHPIYSSWDCSFVCIDIPLVHIGSSVPTIQSHSGFWQWMSSTLAKRFPGKPSLKLGQPDSRDRTEDNESAVKFQDISMNFQEETFKVSPLLGGSSQLGDLRSPWLLTTY